MTAEQFYEEFKAILNQLEVGFSGKEHVEMLGQLTFTTETPGKKMVITLNIGGPYDEQP